MWTKNLVSLGWLEPKLFPIWLGCHIVSWINFDITQIAFKKALIRLRYPYSARRYIGTFVQTDLQQLCRESIRGIFVEFNFKWQQINWLSTASGAHLCNLRVHSRALELQRFQEQVIRLRSCLSNICTELRVCSTHQTFHTDIILLAWIILISTKRLEIWVSILNAKSTWSENVGKL